MNHQSLSHMESIDFDVMVFNNYIDFNMPKLDFSTYSDINVVCFSLGVYVYSQLQNHFPVVNSMSVINGTCSPINKDFGIAPEIFQGTISNFNEMGRQKFFRRMFSDKENFELFSKNLENSNVELQKNELIALQNTVLNSKEKSLKPRKVIISEKDRIIPTANQKNYWKSENIVLLAECGHFPFFNFKNFDELI